MCSSTLSVNCEKAEKATQRYPDCRSPISQRSPVSGLRQAIQGKGVILKRVETAGVYPLNSRFTLFLSLAHTRDWRPLRNRGTAEDFYYRVFLNLFEGSDTLLLHIRFHQRKVRHSSAAQFVGTW